MPRDRKATFLQRSLNNFYSTLFFPAFCASPNEKMMIYCEKCMLLLSYIIIVIYVAVFLKMLHQIDLSCQTVFSSKVATIKTECTHALLFHSFPVFLFALCFSPFLFQFITRKKSLAIFHTNDCKISLGSFSKHRLHVH